MIGKIRGYDGGYWSAADLFIRKLKEPGVYCDRDGLRLQVTKSRTTESLSKSWLVRFTLPGGKVREMGLGSYDDLTLADAREQALMARKLAKRGIDPILERDAVPEPAPTPVRIPTFRECAEEYIETNKSGWRNGKHAEQWPSTLKMYVYPHFGDLPVDQVSVRHVKGVLDPIWKHKNETASRVRQRIERVLAAAAVLGHRPRENPAQWRHNLEYALPKPTRVKKVRHHPALPIDEMPTFMKMLRQRDLAHAAMTCSRRQQTFNRRRRARSFIRSNESPVAPARSRDLRAKHLVSPVVRKRHALYGPIGVVSDAQENFVGAREFEADCVDIADFVRAIGRPKQIAHKFPS
ncbi:MAG: DUF4102 domain-containing protein [Caulobacteraceae bacterium]|nr:DUF4102 domain-containing protein [Caulobacteraceae bacterium]